MSYIGPGRATLRRIALERYPWLHAIARESRFRWYPNNGWVDVEASHPKVHLTHVITGDHELPVRPLWREFGWAFTRGEAL